MTDQAQPTFIGLGGLRLGLRVGLLVVVLDQISKWWILANVSAGTPIPMAPFFNLVLTGNRGVSFGMFANEHAVMPYVLVAVSLAISAFLLVWMRRAKRALVVAALGLVVGGAIGNVIDRLRFGAVVDFLDFHAFGWHWPAFNVADAGITVGVLLILVDGLVTRKEQR